MRKKSEDNANLFLKFSQKKNQFFVFFQESQDTSQALCGRSLVSTTVSTNPSCSTAQIDVAAFEQTTRELVGRAANMKTRFWLKFCVVWPLGPQDIRRIHREVCWENRKKSIFKKNWFKKIRN